MAIKIDFYRKPGCWACDSAEDLLNGLAEKYDLDINKVDITTSNELYEEYHLDIPVLEFPNEECLWGEIKIKRLRAMLDEYK